MTVEAFRGIADDDGRLPAAPKVRERLVDAGLVDGPKRSIADGLQLRIAWMEEAVPQLEPHERLVPLLDGYAARLRDVATGLVAIADAARPAIVAPGEPCMHHGVRRDARGICRACRRPDLSAAARAGAVAA